MNLTAQCVNFKELGSQGQYTCAKMQILLAPIGACESTRVYGCMLFHFVFIICPQPDKETIRLEMIKTI